MRKVLASADIGSNTVHLLIAESDGKSVQRIINQSEWLSLGEAVARTGLIPNEKALFLNAVLRDYKQEVLNMRAERFYVFATEAMRSARNSAQVLESIRQDIGIEVNLISPRQEAELSLNGISLDCRLPEDCLLFEVGGGSAQIAHCRRKKIQEEYSLQVGTGKLIAETGLSSPATPSTIKRAEAYIAKQLDQVDLNVKGYAAYASGGVARGLIRALHPDGDQELHFEELDFIIWSTSQLNQSRIVQRFGVKPKRASALLPGALVYRALMERFGSRTMRVSEFGVREGAILLMAKSPEGTWLE